MPVKATAPVPPARQVPAKTTPIGQTRATRTERRERHKNDGREERYALKARAPIRVSAPLSVAPYRDMADAITRREEKGSRRLSTPYEGRLSLSGI